MIAVGDFNVAAEQRDVHSAINWEGQYTPAELGALHGLLGCCADSWRHLHPQQEGVYTVWNERTSARAFNVVCAQSLAHAHDTCMQPLRGINARLRLCCADSGVAQHRTARATRRAVALTLRSSALACCRTSPPVKCSSTCRPSGATMRR